MRLNLLVLIVMTFTSASLVYAHNGGNGGDGQEIMIKNNLLNISKFLNTEKGRILFEDEVDPVKFFDTVKKVDIRISDEELKDKFGAVRCALNFPEKDLAIFNRPCVEKLKSNTKDFFVLISHEILNIMGLELPDEKGGSVYPISLRIGNASASISQESKSYVLSPTCNLDILNRSQGLQIPEMGLRILKDKGYVDIKKLSDDKRNKDHVLIEFHLRSQRYDKYVINGTELVLDGSAYEIDSSFIGKKYNGLLMSVIQNDFILFTPASVYQTRGKFKTENGQIDSFEMGQYVGRTNSDGDSFTLSLKRGYKPAFIETLLKVPTCIKY